MQELISKTTEKLKYILEETFPDISNNDINIIINIGKDVMQASWHFAKIFIEDETFWSRRNQIEIVYAKNGSEKAQADGNVKLVEYLKNPDTLFYLSSCRVVAFGYATGKNDALESMIKSVARIID